MQLTEALRTTGSIREFSAERVDDETIARILDTARFAPSGGNRQSWRVVVVKDPAVRRGLRDIYVHAWYEYMAQGAAGLVPFSPTADPAAAAAASANAPKFAELAAASGGGFAEHLDEVPALVAVFVDMGFLAALDKDGDRYQFAGGASVYPFVWSILLAAREEGLGGVMTTMPIRHEPDVLQLMHAPPNVAMAALIALGHPVKRHTKLRRQTVEDFATVDLLDGPTFAAAYR